MASTKRILVALVKNRPGVLNRMSSLFRRRNFNIESIAVGHSEQPGLSRVTVVVNGSSTVVEQVRKQLDRLIDVVKVFDITSNEKVSRELALIKVRATSTTRSEIIQIVDVFRANIVDVAPDSVTVEVAGDEDKVNSLFDLLRGFGIREMARTGSIAMSRGGIGALRVRKEQRASPLQRKEDKKSS